MKLEKPFNVELLYNHLLHYYIDKKGCTKDEANEIAQKVITRELQRRICKYDGCHHLSHQHVENQGTCFVLNCSCKKFLKYIVKSNTIFEDISIWNHLMH